MTVWSHSTASGDLISPSFHTQPVGRPERLPSPPSPPHPTWLHSQKSPSIVCRCRWWISHLQSASCFFQGGNLKKKEITVVVLWALLKNWPQRERELTLTLHFLVIMLYTEQASIHHNDCGNVVLHNWGHWNKFWKGPIAYWKYNISQEFHLPWTKTITWTMSLLFIEWVINLSFILFDFGTIQIQTSGLSFFFFFFASISECSVSNKVNLSAYWHVVTHAWFSYSWKHHPSRTLYYHATPWWVRLRCTGT